MAAGRQWCGTGAALVRQRCGTGAAVVRHWCGQPTQWFTKFDDGPAAGGPPPNCRYVALTITRIKNNKLPRNKIIRKNNRKFKEIVKH